MNKKNKSVKSLNPCKSVIQTNSEIMEANRGEINVNTKDGEGTKFIVRLPLDKT